jgi:hypothetical protein
VGRVWARLAVTDDRRPTTDDRRPTTDDRRPTTDDRAERRRKGGRKYWSSVAKVSRQLASR